MAQEPLKLGKGVVTPLSLSKPINKINIGLGWEVLSGNALDLDVSAIGVKSTGKVETTADVCFYGQLSAANGAIVSSGDDRTGGNSVDGDDETILVDFTKLPDYLERIEVYVTIHEAKQRNHHFGLLNDAYAKIYNAESGETMFIIDLDEEAFGKQAMHVATLSKVGGKWNVTKVAKPLDEDLFVILPKYGVPVTA